MVSDYAAEIIAVSAAILAGGAEWLHRDRIRRIHSLVFGVGRRSSVLAWLAPGLRVIACTAIAWGLVSLFQLPPQVHDSEVTAESQKKHVVILLDVSPSMRLVDAGTDGKLSRMARAKEVLLSFFDRVPVRQYKLSVIAFYDRAIPVVIDTKDMEVVLNTLSDLPMHYAFKGKETNLFAGLKEMAEIVRPWEPNSTVVIVISDGDSVPPTGMPPMPPSVSGVLMVGVGDPVAGKFINGRNSKQDVSTLRQVATRLRGEFHNANSNQISTALIQQLTTGKSKPKWLDLSRREYSLLALASGAVILGCLPWSLHYFGSRWQPGRRA